MQSKATWKLSWLGLTSLYLVILLWHRLTTGELSFLVAVWLFSMLLVSLMVGDIFQRWALKDSERFNNQPTRLLTGILLVNVILLIASLTLPFRLAVDWIIILVFVIIIWVRTRRINLMTDLLASNKSETIFFFVIPLAITAWCQDLLKTIELNSDIAVIRAWQDIFYHLSQINVFAQSHGFGTISDVQMATATMQPYHMASYMLPALQVDVTGTTSLVAYGSLLVPLGILMTGLAAYSLANVVFGQWPALAASLALVLIPDAAQQGFGNGFLGYHWVQQIGPASLYGVASAACAFMLILNACLTSKYRLIFWGYFFALVTLLYKAQIFVAISYLAFMLPVLFMSGRFIKYRIPLVAILTCFYFAVAMISQAFPGIPVMRLDGSGLTSYIASIMGTQSEGFIKREFLSLFKNYGDIWPLKAGILALMLTICTIGVLPIIYVILLGHLKHHFRPVVWLFPIMVLMIYLIMSLGLAMDDRHIGSPEELLHRPLVWFYFVFIVWCAGASYHRLFGDAIPNKISLCWLLILLTLSLAIIPIKLGEKVQFFELTGLNYQKLPKCQVEVASYIREKSRTNEVVQDSLNDPHFILSALSERKPFAIDAGGFRMPAGIESRLDLLKELKKFKAAQDVEIFMKTQDISWYVVSPAGFVMWEESINNHLVFECGGYRVYHF